MNPLQKLSECGLQAEAAGDRLIIRPASKISPDLEKFIIQNKPLILAALRTPTNDPPIFVYNFRVDGAIVTTHSEHAPADFLRAMIERFGNDRRITICEHWPIHN